uniref:Uncharacterized protein n=1 Tax=Strigamia maritima TaxID=126957 RepID=T1JFY9_STRMM
MADFRCCLLRLERHHGFHITEKLETTFRKGLDKGLANRALKFDFCLNQTLLELSGIDRTTQNSYMGKH